MFGSKKYKDLSYKHGHLIGFLWGTLEDSELTDQEKLAKIKGHLEPLIPK